MEIKNFAILKGEEVKIEKGVITLSQPEIHDNSDSSISKERVNADIRTDFLFSNGTIELKFKTNNYSTGVLLLFETDNQNGISIGLSKHYNSFIIGDGIKKITPITYAGTLKNYQLNEERKLKIQIDGSFAKLYIDNVLVVESFVSIKEAPITFRISSQGELQVYDIKIASVKPKIFVVMQFTKEYNELFEDVIRPIAESAGYECIRADEFYTSTPIIKDIVESIQSSTAIIAEITPDNPNVFYEIGYSHAINKPTILLCDRKREKLPFDLTSFRTLFYENTISGKLKVETSLKKYLDNIK
ncbi:TIR domain-containing protein [Flavobacterium silvaticum]|uniref:Uncharacterized protein n=1 Tax=Flavobacterium silvaticum TaxID=1852020 RepID=A0A972FXA7_9FLAO|nr:hypothetical protein [Flavobacterium silvaticum]NMH26556.1 hypothetical protein [Flavobacterium silvaticum]